MVLSDLKNFQEAEIKITGAQEILNKNIIRYLE